MLFFDLLETSEHRIHNHIKGHPLGIVEPRKFDFRFQKTLSVAEVLPDSGNLRYTHKRGLRNRRNPRAYDIISSHPGARVPFDPEQQPFFNTRRISGDAL